MQDGASPAQVPNACPLDDYGVVLPVTPLVVQPAAKVSQVAATQVERMLGQQMTQGPDTARNAFQRRLLINRLRVVLVYGKIKRSLGGRKGGSETDRRCHHDRVRSV